MDGWSEKGESCEVKRRSEQEICGCAHNSNEPLVTIKCRIFLY
jgi:hypothetical protein